MDGPPKNPPDLSRVPDAIPQQEARSRYGNPKSYVVFGKRYHVMDQKPNHFKQEGLASWYGTQFHGQRTSSGEPYDMYKMTGAHKTLPLPTYARITNLENKNSVVIKINDRGPFHDNRILDLSYAAAHKLGILGKGTAKIELIALSQQDLNTQNAQQAQSTPSIQGSQRNNKNNSDSKLILQLGAFKNRKNAESLRQQASLLLKEHWKIAPLGTSTQTVYRVQSNPLSREKITELKAKLIKLPQAHPIVLSAR
jgi:rare lipoprotein A